MTSATRLSVVAFPSLGAWATAWLADTAANNATHSSWRFTMCLLKRL
jgi:hypothetical protein